MTKQITYKYDQGADAIKAVGEDGISRTVLGDGTSRTVCVIDPTELAELRDAAEAWRVHAQPAEDGDLPPGYNPYQHTPSTGPDRLLPTAPVMDVLARVFHSKTVAELSDAAYTTVFIAAEQVLLNAVFDADDSGAVPILMLAGDRDAPEPRMLWQLAYKTGVHGLYLRTTGSSILGPTWGIVTGSGYRLLEGWWTRELAELACGAVGRALPGVDWMRIKQGHPLPPEAVAALKKIANRYRDTEVLPGQPDPEPVAVTFP
jgi:hypothetical protein